MSFFYRKKDRYNFFACALAASCPTFQSSNISLSRILPLPSGVNFINILGAHFFVPKQIEQLFSNYVQLCDFWRQNFV